MTEQGAKDRHATVAEQFEDPGQQLEADILGMWVFMATEVLMFAGVFAGYAMYRIQFAEAFAEAAGHLYLHLGAANTAVLLTSGVTMSLTEPMVRRHRRGPLLLLLGITMALGVLFLGIKGYEYAREFHEHLMPLFGLRFEYPGAHADKAQLFFNFYYAMTGLHALHMTIGLGLLAVMAVLAWRWRTPDRLARQVRIVGMYWALVDIVWIFIFPALYLLHA